MRAQDPAPMEPVELGKLNINNDQFRLGRRKLLKDLPEIGNAVYLIRPLGQPLLNLAKQRNIVLNQHYFEQYSHLVSNLPAQIFNQGYFNIEAVDWVRPPCFYIDQCDGIKKGPGKGDP
ncbi:hypothetical protein D3C87_1613320 [compost metagenome]